MVWCTTEINDEAHEHKAHDGNDFEKSEPKFEFVKVSVECQSREESNTDVITVLDTSNADCNHASKHDRNVDGQMLRVVIPVLDHNGTCDDFGRRGHRSLEPELLSQSESHR